MCEKKQERHDKDGTNVTTKIVLQRTYSFDNTCDKTN